MQAIRKGAEAGDYAVGRTADELAHNEKLHKGVAFGALGAELVSNYVWQKVGEQVANVLYDQAAMNVLKAVPFARKAGKYLVSPEGELLKSRLIDAKEARGIFKQSREEITSLSDALKALKPDYVKYY